MPNVKEKQKELAPVPSHVIGEVEHCPPYAHDAVFGELNEDGPNYRNVSVAAQVLARVDDRIANDTSGWMARNNHPDDEDPDRTRRPFHSLDL